MDSYQMISPKSKNQYEDGQEETGDFSPTEAQSGENLSSVFDSSDDIPNEGIENDHRDRLPQMRILQIDSDSRRRRKS